MHDIWTSVFIPLEVEDTFVEVVMSEAPVDARCRGAHLKKLCRAEGGAKFFVGISCEKSRFYAKKIIFFSIAEGGAKIFGVFRVKNHDFTPKNHIFFQSPPPMDPPLEPLLG